MFTELKNRKSKCVFKITPTLREYCIGMNSKGDACYVTHRCPNCEPPKFIHLKLEAQEKVKPVPMSVFDRHPWPQAKRKGGEEEMECKGLPKLPIKNPGYGSYAHLHAATHEDYVQLNALSDENKRKLIDNGFYDKDTVTFDEAIEFFHNLKVSEAEISRMYRYDEDIEGEGQ